MNFSEIGVVDCLVKALNENNINQPTEIQEKVIPSLLNNNKDLVGIAQTGTGKTAAYILPLLQLIDPKKTKIQALILAPTRELAQQVKKESFVLSRYTERIFSEVVFGGKKIDEQIEKLKRPTHILVATPGRLVDLLDKGAVDLSEVKYFVMDEADEMLKMGFKEDIDSIIEACPVDATRMLFSATMPMDIENMIKDYLSPSHVQIKIKAEEFVNKNISHHFLTYKYGYKLDFLKELIKSKEGQGILFCRTKAAVKLLGQQLAGFQIKSDVIHGDLKQHERDKVMRSFKAKRISLLIATDIAARGIDVPNLNYVLHYHLPEKEEQYTHRSGRTARAGKSGDSILFVLPEEVEEMVTYEETLKIKVNKLHLEVDTQKREYKQVQMYVNIGAIHGFDEDSFRGFVNDETGVKIEHIEEVEILSDFSSLTVDKKYEDQVYFNLKGKKRFHTNIKLTTDFEETKNYLRNNRRR